MLRPLQLQICGGLTRILSVLLLSVLCCSAAVAQQNVTVTGVVTNEAKQPIVGATVIQEPRRDNRFERSVHAEHIRQERHLAGVVYRYGDAVGSRQR